MQKVRHVPELHQHMLQVYMARQDVQVKSLTDIMHQQLLNQMESIGPKRIEKVVGLTTCSAPLSPNQHGSAPQQTINSAAHIKYSLLALATKRAKPPGTKRCIKHGLCSRTTDECRPVRQMVSNVHSSQSAANKSQTQTAFKGIGQEILRRLHNLKAGRFGKKDPSCPSAIESRHPRHDICGHHHPPHVNCYGPDYTPHEPAPDLQGIHSSNTAATAHT